MALALASNRPAASGLPVCADLDGTLIAGDLFWESLLSLLKHRPQTVLALLWWARGGRARIKHEVARRVPIDPARLPYRPEVVRLLQAARGQGRDVVLATGADETHALAVAAHLGLFTMVLASDGTHNLTGRRKAARLRAVFGEGGYEYLGNSRADVPSWLTAARATAVAAPRHVVRYIERHVPAVDVLVPATGTLRPLLRALRPYQWVKNLLIPVPLVTSHTLLEPERLWPTVAMVVAFCLCASGIYAANDLLDIDADRQHPRKRLRPFAAGALPVPAGVLIAAGGVGAGLAVSAAVSAAAAGVVALYAVISMAYSVRLKREPVTDVFVLAGLYVLRVAAGGVAADIVLSSWLLAFAMFLFLSLAFVKRYAELTSTVEGAMPGRGYRPADARWMHAIGTSAGYMAVLVLALYLTSPEVTVLYRAPAVLWLLCPLLLYWVTRIWFRAARATVMDDPVLDTIRDLPSYATLLAGALVLFGAL